jgi:hypothetical protein
VLIVASGMPRSGSTWLYNVIRLIIRTGKPEINWQCGWLDDLNWEEESDCLVKVHRANDIMSTKADVIFYSYRDIRDSVASLKRKLNKEPSISSVDQMMADDSYWRKRAIYSMKYEDMLSSPESVVTNIAKTLKIITDKPGEIVTQIAKLSYESIGTKNDIYHAENLLHKGHITDGRVGSWKGYIPEPLVAEIEKKYSSWFVSNGYELTVIE